MLNCLAGAAILGLIVWYGQGSTAEAFRGGTFEGELPVQIQTWPIWGAITLGAGLPESAFDVVVECSGIGHGYADALKFARRAGQIAQMGLGGEASPLPTDLI